MLRRSELRGSTSPCSLVGAGDCGAWRGLLGTPAGWRGLLVAMEDQRGPSTGSDRATRRAGTTGILVALTVLELLSH